MRIRRSSAYAEATVEMINPSLTIVKTTNGDDGLTFLVGTPLTWSYLVTNNGDAAAHQHRRDR